MRCTYCGAVIPDGMLRCEKCGTEVQIVPDYNPLDDVLAQQVKGSIDGSTRPLDYYENEEYQRAVARTDQRAKPSQPVKQKRQPTQRELRQEAEERRRQQLARKKAIRKRRRQRRLIILSFILVVACVLGFIFYQNSYQGLVRKGNNAFAQKDYTSATDYYNRAEKKNSSRPEAYTGLANVLVAQDSTEDAEALFLTAIDSQPSNADLYEACIQFYTDTEQMTKISILIDGCDDDTVLSALSDYVSDVPEFSLTEGDYTEVQEVSLSSDGESIYYTTDSTDPTTDSTEYSGAIQLSEGENVIKAISLNKKGIPSLVQTKVYNIEIPVADAPAVTPSTGQYDTATNISINVPEGYTAYYTLDGSAPNAASIQYTEPIDMPVGQTIFSAVLINAQGKSTQVTKRNYMLEYE
ncbi:chitobiase/beta-hexosaminidase C-terminal domain-containing protein [Hespellia stercorisuis]|uniref:Tetratricopeptide repeat-containing protein n=1 Tax=Hespellia stercorisuis DSM 15480 TaxID=1121950 RepID=A0A1M6N5P9_9FIRM|nr:chitobiase/beta-hexosaminidase C-terminal domain-containing protein [Hespellia stercorisuis]SHJ90973.1 Tetratricopeptide repeat-containing protein [Hespellia stercorisuis DSM 15480]